MKWHSSIFSFDTLNVRPSLPRGCLLCLALVGALNWVVHLGLSSGALYTSVPTGLVEELYTKANQPANLWLFGNSTLEASIDEPALERALGAEVHRFVLGSATFEAMTRLARAMLERSSAKPTQIAFFVTKDDFNAHGARASASTRYLRAIEAPPLSERVLNSIPLYAARYSVRQKLRLALAGALAGSRQRSDRAPGSEEHGADIPAEPAASIQPAFDFKSTYLANLGEQFEFDSDGFPVLADLARSRQVEILVVHPPVTRAVWDWQDYFVPGFDSRRVRDSLVSHLTQIGSKFVDFADLYPSSDVYFKDAYHLRASRALAFSERIAVEFKRGLVSSN